MGRKSKLISFGEAKKSNLDLVYIVYIGRILELDLDNEHAEKMAALLRD